MKSYKVRIWEIGQRTARGKVRYRVRWTVDGAPKPFQEEFRTKALANSFRSELVKASKDGEPFDPDTGRPMSEVRTANTPTWYAHARSYVKQKWPGLAANSRRGTVESLTTVTMLLLKPTKRGRPTDAELRRALYLYAFNPLRWSTEPDAEHAAALAWLERESLPVTDLESTVTVRRVLDGLCVRLDGKPAAAATVSRKRAVFYNTLGYALELGLLASNPVDRVQWKAPAVSQAIDRRVVANPTQVAELLDGVKSLGKRADRVRAFFGCIYYAGTRPSEAADLRRDDCELPGACITCGTYLPDVSAVIPSASCSHEKIECRWGRITLVETDPRTGSHWTDDGRSHERRGLKHRPRKATRSVPIPPVYVAMLAYHIREHGTAPDGRLFRGIHGGPLSESVYDRWWKLARKAVLTPTQVKSPLARRAYDLRHAAASRMLNSGVPATDVAFLLGNSVAVLLAVYANCIDGGEDDLKNKIDSGLA